MTPEATRAAAATLTDYLKPAAAPLAITFADEPPAGTQQFDDPMAEPAPDGRTGRVPAGCVFWMKATDRTFATVAEDHGNCSVGSVTHGFKGLEEIANNADVHALLESGWVTMDAVPHIPVVKEGAGYVVYGPLSETQMVPDVVFLRLNAKQAMVLHDAVPEIRFEGKPQCHIVPMAKEQGEIAVSVGCMLSRVRTGMPNGEMTAAIPGHRLEEVLERLKSTCAADNQVAAYASEDAARFTG